MNLRPGPTMISALAAIGLVAGCASPRTVSTADGITNAWGPVRPEETRRTEPRPAPPDAPARAEPVPMVRVGIIDSGPAEETRGEPDDDDPGPVTACTGPLEATEPLYRLPYAVGEAFFVRQSTCGPVSHRGRFSFSYDFDMPRGTPVLAAREGVVTAVVAHHPEGTNRSADANYVVVRHGNGESSRYLHLRTDGSNVRVGDRVRAGDVIAYSGNSGRSGRPHLHFDVVSDCGSGPCPTIPATFQNATHRAPRAGRTYRALDLE